MQCHVKSCQKWWISDKNVSWYCLGSSALCFLLQEQYARVTAIRTGLPLDPQRINDPIIYNIGMERMFYVLVVAYLYLQQLTLNQYKYFVAIVGVITQTCGRNIVSQTLRTATKETKYTKKLSICCQIELFWKLFFVKIAYKEKAHSQTHLLCPLPPSHTCTPTPPP